MHRSGGPLRIHYLISFVITWIAVACNVAAAVFAASWVAAHCCSEITTFTAMRFGRCFPALLV